VAAATRSRRRRLRLFVHVRQRTRRALVKLAGRLPALRVYTRVRQTNPHDKAREDRLEPPDGGQGCRLNAQARSRRLTADDVMLAREVAGLLHAPVSTVEDWARRGILPSVKIGRRRLYIREQIETVLTKRS